MSEKITEHSGSKYLRTIHSADQRDATIKIDVYSVLLAFNVTCPATQHAIKKMLCAGQRGKADKVKDIEEAIDALQRAKEIAQIGTILVTAESGIVGSVQHTSKRDNGMHEVSYP